MTATAQTIAGAGTNVSRGATAWNNPSRITVDQGNATSANSASIAITGAGGSDYLVGASFGFAIPSDATINGVKFEARQLGTVAAVNVQLQDDTATLIGSSKSYTATASSTVTLLGSSSDVWGATLTPAIVNDADFGVRIWNTLTGNTMRLDAVWLTVYYTAASGVKAVARSCGVVGT